jgi:ankyrin repeat protein
MANILLLPANHHVEFEISPKDPKNKIDVNHSTKDGATALILAVQNSDFPTTKLLLDHG